jgi:hypothetical protein
LSQKKMIAAIERVKGSPDDLTVLDRVMAGGAA